MLPSVTGLEADFSNMRAPQPTGYGRLARVISSVFTAAHLPGEAIDCLATTKTPISLPIFGHSFTLVQFECLGILRFAPWNRNARAPCRPPASNQPKISLCRSDRGSLRRVLIDICVDGFRSELKGPKWLPVGGDHSPSDAMQSCRWAVAIIEVHPSTRRIIAGELLLKGRTRSTQRLLILRGVFQFRRDIARSCVRPLISIQPVLTVCVDNGVSLH